MTVPCPVCGETVPISLGVAVVPPADPAGEMVLVPNFATFRAHLGSHPTNPEPDQPETPPEDTEQHI